MKTVSLPNCKCTRMKRHFIKEIKVANRHIKKCLLTLRIKEAFHWLNKTLGFVLVPVQKASVLGRHLDLSKTQFTENQDNYICLPFFKNSLWRFKYITCVHIYIITLQTQKPYSTMKYCWFFPEHRLRSPAFCSSMSLNPLLLAEAMITRESQTGLLISCWPSWME